MHKGFVTYLSSIHRSTHWVTVADFTKSLKIGNIPSIKTWQYSKFCLALFIRANLFALIYTCTYRVMGIQFSMFIS